ncbi:hypothetical protein N7452_011358 [Penicillium brevicompactum]|uniref:Small EDRK-rich factor-like N-terminal domain-containing protein n=1 Tax=Penicillium brevicompactum TaxID=5074 RepID=A0A9W9Q2C6_PENBR|nr:hypothetical protein N7452_011358 [Penicillium brevicompactum]
MARGNQRDKAREKNLKKQGNVKNKNTQTGTQFAKSQEDAAAIMREKQKKGASLSDTLTRSHYSNRLPQPMKNEPPRQQRVGRNNTLILDTPFDIAIATSHYAKRERKDDIKEFWTPERHFIHALYRPSEAF